MRKCLGRVIAVSHDSSASIYNTILGIRFTFDRGYPYIRVSIEHFKKVSNFM